MKKILTAILALAIILLTGCSQKTETATGTLVMQITDAPVALNIEKAEVTISNIQVHKAAEGEANETETESGWFDVVSEAKNFDLVAIKDVKAILGSTELEPGKYTQIRLNVDKATATIDGQQYDLEVPSGKIKLVKGFTLEVNKTITLTLDFDAQESIKATSSDKYVMQPTIKVIQERDSNQPQESLEKRLGLDEKEDEMDKKTK